jgi:co-chaperonin GroES (HSP10)
MKEILKDRLLVEKVKVERKSSILDVIEDESGPLTGKVLKVGKLVEDIKVDDVILYKENDALPISIDGKNLVILRDYDIIGIL